MPFVPDTFYSSSRLARPAAAPASPRLRCLTWYRTERRPSESPGGGSCCPPAVPKLRPAAAAPARGGVPAATPEDLVRDPHPPSGHVRYVPILAPFRHIAVHIVESPGIRLVTANAAGAAEIGTLDVRPIGDVAVAVRLAAVEFLPEVKRRCRPRAAGILPLGFGGQAKLPTLLRLLLVQLLISAGPRCRPTRRSRPENVTACPGSCAPPPSPIVLPRTHSGFSRSRPRTALA